MRLIKQSKLVASLSNSEPAIDKVIQSHPGEFEKWDEAWSTIKHPLLYTSGNPRILLEFWQKSYFEDLWAIMGEKASSARYLELGSGRGTTSMYLRARNCDVTMLDLAAHAFHLAKVNFKKCDIKLPKLVFQMLVKQGY